MSDDDIGAEARRAFEGGMFCAESVLSVLAARQGVTDPHLAAMATGFCSGLSRSCGPCGAVTGAVMGIGLALGRDRPGQAVEPAYAATRELLGRFAAEFGSTNCAELLGCDLATPEGQQRFREHGLAARCRAYTARAAEIAAELTPAAGQDPSGAGRSG